MVKETRMDREKQLDRSFVTDLAGALYIVSIEFHLNTMIISIG